MGTTDSDIMSQGEVESLLQSSEQQSNNQSFPSLGRQLSIYSLTLDEFQHKLCDESGKNFGSMNMDEFLNSIWTAEENQAQVNAQLDTGNSLQGAQSFLRESTIPTDKGIAKQHSISRQASLTIPEPLCRKTVDEVWSDIHKTQQQKNSEHYVQNPDSAQRQPTFGEMTLEDFLVKAGVVREQDQAPAPPQQQPYGIYPNNNNHTVGPTFATRPVRSVGGAAVTNVATYQTLPQSSIGEVAGFPGEMTQVPVYTQQPSAVYGGRIGNGSGAGYRQGQVLGMDSPVSPVSSDGLCKNQLDSGNQYGVDMGGAKGGRKRVIDGPVEKVVERRQRRMIKNRESAARSRARKQAYTVELEAELNQLKEENTHLEMALAELERKRKQQHFEEAMMKAQVQTKAHKANEKLRAFRRAMSCHY
ncbi:ABSCISIC ACID-INSENSITIVE 5 isoform X1 [Olea europaea subsp. europaea]|uniref:ABSCISIC ACID-INSENSITIVE 5 isoform X1 n=1 Tax=Olea europaea subsp. europaea TaxID=158383 RepID=A0A8S0UIW8_OLEEU|nr:ABSCISIC ACID-INSENSITIVE 5 isoform X1 [Olea europaea subsp. europaea]